MIDETVLKKIMGAILKVDPASIDANASSDTIESWDSLKHLNLVLAIEEEFGVSIPDEDAANITSYALVKITLEDLLRSR